MPTRATWTRILVLGYDLSGQSNVLKLNVDAQALEYDVFQTSATQSIPGDPAIKLEHSGYFDSGDPGNIERTIYARLQTDATQVALILGTNLANQIAYILPSAYSAKLSVDTSIGQLITVAGEWTATGRTYRGSTLWTGSISATGTKTALNFGSAGAAGGKAWIFIHSIAGTATNATITVQSDDNSGFTTPTTRGTFTFSTGDTSAEITLAAVEQYMRINVTSMGGATSFDVTALIGVSGITY